MNQQVVDVETGELVVLPVIDDPLAIELRQAVERMLGNAPGPRRDALTRHAYTVRNRTWKERQRLYNGNVVTGTGVLVDQWAYLNAHKDAPAHDEWEDMFIGNLRRYEALCDALDATRGVL